MEYSSNAKGNLGVTLGAIGTGLGALSGLTQAFGAEPKNQSNINGNFITRQEIDVLKELASRDAEIALLNAEKLSDQKILEAYKITQSEVKELRNEFNSNLRELEREVNMNRREQDQWNASQSVANAQISAAIATNTNSISSIQNTLSQITMLKVPNTAVCPGWGNITITPTTTTTTA